MNTEKLKQAALKATWGGGMYSRPIASLKYAQKVTCLLSAFPGSIDNASFIAAANPATILALLSV